MFSDKSSHSSISNLFPFGSTRRKSSSISLESLIVAVEEIIELQEKPQAETLLVEYESEPIEITMRKS